MGSESFNNRGYAHYIIQKKNDQLRYCRRRLSKKLKVNDYQISYIIFRKGWGSKCGSNYNFPAMLQEALSHRAMYAILQAKEVASL